jgi:hypothetical protein
VDSDIESNSPTLVLKRGCISEVLDDSELSAVIETTSHHFFIT